MKIFATLLAYVLALLVVASVTFIVVLVVAGPHAGLLPLWLETVVLGGGWLMVLVLPIVFARKVWHRLMRDENTNVR